MAAGRVIRFDGMRGYGFIAPAEGGEDIFLHVNDLLIPEASLHPGLMVEFEVEEGGRGLKASKVRLLESDEALPQESGAVGARGSASGTDAQEPMCDVLGSAEFRHEVTELLLTSVPELTGHQIQSLRKQLALLGKRHGWVED
ncbi:cold-shock protein [Streptomyces boninensis]|uniref:cold-shock protein n=1 Tax=Streptomyces boninensis TaxID=2039455 RepID=UPI003B225989